MSVRPASRPLRLVALMVAAAAVLLSRDRGGVQAQTAGPVAAYAFSDGAGLVAADASGNNNAGALDGPAWARSNYGGGLQLDGLDDDVQIPASSSLDLTGGFTFETWIKPASASDSYIWWRQQDSGQDAYVLELKPNGTVTAAMYTSTAYYPLTTLPRVPLNTWTHLAVTYDGTNLKIYFDATEVARRTVAGTLVASSQPLYLGEWFPGLLDEARIYRRPLSASEIALDRGTPVDPSTPFQVTVSTPANTAAGVLTAPITAMFSRPVNSGTVTTGSFELRDTAGTLVNTTVGYNPATRSATLTPASPLAPASDYNVRVVAGSGGVTDAAGNPLAADLTWTFRTAAGVTTPSAMLSFSENAGTTSVDWSGNGNQASLVNASWTPGRFGSGVRVAGGSDEVQVPASETLALSNAFTFETWIYPTQYVWGDLWKQFLADGNQMYGLMLTGSGAVYYSQRVNNVDYPLTTTTALPLNAWTHVAVTYDGSSIRIFFNGTEMASRSASGSLPPTSQPMEIGQWTVGKLDEIRIYRAALDAAAINIDIAAPVDPTPPFQVTGSSPAGSGLLTPAVTATFSRAVDPSSLTTSTFMLRDGAGAPVPANVSYNAPTRTATLVPTGVLAPLTDYTATVAGGPGGVRDTSGGVLANSFSWTFRTAADTSAPAVAFAFSEGAGTTSADASGNGNGAVLANGSTWTPGQFGNGVRLAGGSAEIQVPLSQPLGLSSAFTFEAWIYPTASGTADLWKQSLPSSAQIYGLQITSAGALSFSAKLNGIDYPVASATRVPLNTWSHVAVSAGAGYLGLFINGVEVAGRSVEGALAGSSQPIEIGQGLAGKIDEVRIYRRALGAAEIALDRVTPIDTAAPFAVSGTTPSNGSLGVLATPVTATFSHPALPASINAGTFVLRDRANALVPATVSYDAASRTATLRPSSPLAPQADYTARIIAGGSGVVDATAQVLPADVTWTFRTAAAATAPGASYALLEGTGATTADNSGNGHTASLVSGPAWTSGRFGGGIRFAGGYDELQAPAGETLAVSGAFTFEAWVRPTAYAWGDLFSQWEDEGSQIYGISTTGTGSVYVSPRLGDTDYPLFTAATLPLNTWTHVAVTYDGAYLRVYFDGVEVANRSASGSLEETTQPIEMGQWFQGVLDEVRIYRIALSPSAILDDRNRPIFCSYATSVHGISAPASGVSGSFAVTAADGCTWTPSTTAATWVTVSRTGNTVAYTIAANESASPRTAQLTVADQIVTINQDAAACAAPCGGTQTGLDRVTSSDSEITAVWYQVPLKGGDRRRLDCVHLERANQRGIGEACSFLGMSGDNLKMKWTGRRRLTVTYAPSTKVLKADTRWNDVTITYAKDSKLKKN